MGNSVFCQKICYNLTVYVTLYYTLANIDPYSNGLAIWHDFIDITCNKVKLIALKIF